MKRFFLTPMALAMLATLLLTSTQQTNNLPLPAAEATNSITKVDLKKHLSFLASDELGGRYTFSQGNRIAARYLASQLTSYGFRGAAPDGSFLQNVPLGYRTVNTNQSNITLQTRGVSPGDNGTIAKFIYGEDFISEKPVDTSVKGELVFVGYGINAPQHQHNDYAGLDVKGKIVVAVSGLPEALKNTGFDEDSKPKLALERGAAALILIPAPEQTQIWNYLKSNSTSEQLGLPLRPAPAPEKSFATVLAGTNLVKAVAQMAAVKPETLTSPAGKPLAPRRLTAVAEVRMSVAVKEAPLAQNVVAILEGRDAKLKDEYVVVSAHYDHLETEGNEIYNGADDDGSGTSAVLEIAQAFAIDRPRRSVLIIFHTGEELGLFGSEYITDYAPVVPLGKLVANLNIDMIGRSREANNKDERDKELTDSQSLYIIGSDKLSTEFHRLNEETNRDTARLRFDYLYNDDNHPQQFYYRSDHYNYAKHGIPVIFYFTGVHRDYHQPTDDIANIDFDKMERITRMIFAVAFRVANLQHRLIVDKKAASDNPTR